MDAEVFFEKISLAGLPRSSWEYAMLVLGASGSMSFGVPSRAPSCNFISPNLEFIGTLQKSRFW